MEPDTSLSTWHRLAMAMMGSLVVLTFVMSNLYGQWWQLSDWLVAAVLPAVVIDLTNEERGGVAATPLRRNVLLDAAATKKAEHMAKHSYFAHYAPDGTTPWEFFDEVGYVYAHAGENLAVHFNDSSALVAAWMRSPSHRENIVNSQFSEIGVGTARGRYQGHETVFVVQLFGTPAAAPTPVAVVPLAVPVASIDPVIPPNPPLSESERVTAPSPVVAAAQSDEVIMVETPVDVAPAPDSPLPDVAEAPVEPAVVLPDVESATEVNEEPPLVAEVPEPMLSALPPVDTASAEPRTTFMAISSGLPAIPVAYAEAGTSGTTAVALATQPSRLLQIVYTALSLVVVWLLVASAVRDVRRQQLVRVGYSALLLLLMASLVYIHVQLTSVVVVA